MTYNNQNESKAFLLTNYGYDHRIKAPLVTDEELSNSEFIRDVRAFAYGLHINAADWLPYLGEAYGSYEGMIVNSKGHEVMLDLSCFEVDGDTMFDGSDKADRKIQSIRDWLTEFCRKPCSPYVKPRVRREARERVRVLATILRARNPEAAFFWGMVGKAANDNNPTS